MSSWIGFDLDGTLAVYHGWVSAGQIGRIIEPMKKILLGVLATGTEVRIFTARVSNPDEAPLAHDAIQRWLKANGLPRLKVTNVKDYGMIMLYDDRCMQVEKNTGMLIQDELERHREANQSWLRYADEHNIDVAAS